MMPQPSQITRQTTRPRTQTSASDDAWAVPDRICMLLYGESGTGKTTIWATFPGPIYAIVCSGSKQPGELKSIDTPEYRRKIKAKIAQTSTKIEEYLQEAKTGGYKTVVLDHVTGLQDLTLCEILGVEELPAQKGWGLATQQQWGQSTLQCKTIVRNILNIPHTNVVVVGQERTWNASGDNPDPEIIKPSVSVAATQSLEGWLRPAFDYMVQAFIRPKMKKNTVIIGKEEMITEERDGVEYCLRCVPHDVYRIKFRSTNRNRPEVIVDPTYQKIVKAIKGVPPNTPS